MVGEEYLGGEDFVGERQLDGEYFVGEVVGDLAEEDFLGHSAGVGVDEVAAVQVVAVVVPAVHPAAVVVVPGLAVVVLYLVAAVVAVVAAAGQFAALQLTAAILLLVDVEFAESDPYFSIWGGWDYLTGVVLVILFLTSPDLHHVLLLWPW